VAEKPEQPAIPVPPDSSETESDPGSRFPELDELEREIARRLRDNQRFLERFLDEAFVDEEDDQEESGQTDEEL
jgi:hypothetical protein